MNNNSPVGFDLTNLKKQIAELKASNTIIKSFIKAYQKNQTEKEILQAQIRKLKKDGATLHRLIALRMDPDHYE